MHELSLAQGLLDQLVTLADTHGATTVAEVRVQIGEQAGIVTDSFCFGFDTLKKDAALTRNATLEITHTSGSGLILAQVVME